MSGHCFVGPLFQNQPTSHSRPSEYCVDGVNYGGASHRIGRRNVFGVASAPTPGAYVRLQATEEADLFAALRRQGPCSSEDGQMPQMRGDWVPEEGMFHTTRDALRRATYLRALSVTPVDIVEVLTPPRSNGGRKRTPPDGRQAVAEVRVRNPLDAPLEGLTLVFHYEGGSGKPMPRYREHPLPPTPQGAVTVIEPLAALEEDGAWFYLESVSLEGTSGGCTFVPSTYQRL